MSSFWTRQRVLVAGAVAAVLAVVALLWVVLGGPDEPPSPPAASPSTTTSATPTATPTVTPLTGGPVLAVKIDNTTRSRPRVGVGKADVVYVEPVEGGLTRLLAVFTSSLPPEVGPVRSARESDIELLANYGRVAFAYSGASSYTSRLLPRGTQVNLSLDASRVGFRRDPARQAPYDVIGDTAALLERAGGSVPPADPGFRFGPAPAGGTPAASVTARWSAARMTLTWDAGRRQYLVATDGRKDVGADGRQHGAATVVVQYVSTRMSANRDVTGAATPVVQLTGTGRAVVLRDGRSWQATWAREAASAPTTFSTGGQSATFAPGGPVWVLLVAPGQQVTLG